MVIRKAARTLFRASEKFQVSWPNQNVGSSYDKKSVCSGRMTIVLGALEYAARLRVRVRLAFPIPSYTRFGDAIGLNTAAYQGVIS